MGKLKVALLPTLASFPDELGGVRNVVAALSRHLPRYGCEVVEDPAKADVVHCHAVASWDRVDVYTNHGVYPRPYSCEGHEWGNRQMYSNFVRAGQVTSPARWSTGAYDRFKRDVHVIPNGVDLDELRPGPDRGYVLFGKFVGTEGVAAEGARIALWTARQLCDVRFAFVSVPEGEEVPPNVRVIGPQPHKNMLEWIRKASCYLSATLECFSVQVVEALACGVPVAGMDYGGNSEVFEHGQPGKLVDCIEELPDAVKWCMERRDELGELGRGIAEEWYGWESIVPQYVQLYRGEHGRRRRKGPKASIVVTCYNKESYIEDAVRTALAQQFDQPFEVIVVDDCSTDGSLAIINKFKKQAQVLRTPENSGSAAHARNFGIRRAKGEQIVCLDGDDKMSPQFLQKLSPLLDENPFNAFAYSDFGIIGSDRVVQAAEFDAGKLKQGNFLGCASLFKRSVWERVGGYKNINPSWEDYDLWLSMAEAGFRGVHCPEVLWAYRMHDEGRNAASQSQTRRLRAQVNAYHPRAYKPTVSVVVPVYDQEQWLGEAVDSVLAQTFQDWECVVVNDGSPNDTLAHLYRYRYEPRVRYLKQENKGLAGARNAGIQASRGEYILPLDASDKLAPTFLAEALATMEQCQSRCIVYSDFVAFNDAGAQSQHVQPAYDFKKMVMDRGMMFATSLYPREMWEQVGGYPEDFTIGWEDYAFWIAAGMVGWHGVKCPGFLFWYRQHEGSMREDAWKRKGEIKEQLAKKFGDLYRYLQNDPEHGRAKPPEEQQRQKVQAPVDAQLQSLVARANAGV